MAEQEWRMSKETEALDVAFYSYFACNECCLNHNLCECESDNE